MKNLSVIVNYFSLFSVFLFLVSCNLSEKKEQKENALPNILFIVADDMGYSDFSPFGGEINTPNLQKLADEGVRITNFYTMPTCSPARAIMLTGVDNHLNGFGIMQEAIDIMEKMTPEVTEKLKKVPGYQGALNSNVATIAEILGQNGYQSYITGKWHMGLKDGQWPIDRGFDKSYCLLGGGSSHSYPIKTIVPTDSKLFAENDKLVEVDKDFYSSKSFTDKMLYFIKNGEKDKPFFGYLAFTAPHDPLEVPEEYSNKYEGMYDEGYDVLREKRYQRLVEMGILKDSFPLSIKLTKNWEDLPEEEKRTQARSYEVYAGMIDYLDEQVGRVIDLLKETGQYDNTMIVFISDNGSEWKFIEEYSPISPEYVAKTFDMSYENIGKPGSAESIGPGFAQACMSPFKFYKEETGEGGIRTPTIIKWNKMDKKLIGSINTQAIGHVKDLAITIYNMLGIEYPATYNGNKLEELSGVSMIPFLTGESEVIETDYIGWELHGAKAIRKGDWKLLWNKIDEKWELFNLKTDVGETNDVANDNPEIFIQMKDYWNEYEKINKVLPILRPQF